MNRHHMFRVPSLCIFVLVYLRNTAVIVIAGIGRCGQAIIRLIARYHYYWRCRIDWLSAGIRQTGIYWVVISFNSSWIAQRCVFWKVYYTAFMCECVWGYEAALLFLGQLLVTQEWLICNGCCHSLALAPGDGCTVTNAHTLTFSLRTHRAHKFKTHSQTQICAHANSLTHKESSIPPIQCFDSWQALQHPSSVQPQVASYYIGNTADWIWPDMCIKSSSTLCLCVHYFVCFSLLKVENSTFLRLNKNQLNAHCFLSISASRARS